MSYYPMTESGRFDPVVFALFILVLWWSILAATGS